MFESEGTPKTEDARCQTGACALVTDPGEQSGFKYLFFKKEGNPERCKMYQVFGEK